MGVRVVHTGKVDLDMSGMLDFAVSVAVGIVQRRTAAGTAIDGSNFAPYSPAYEQKLALMGESTNVDLTVTGAYIADIGERSRTVTPERASAVIGPGTGTSAEVQPLKDARERMNTRIAHDLTGEDPGIQAAKDRAALNLHRDLGVLERKHHRGAISTAEFSRLSTEAHTRHRSAIERAHKSFRKRTELTASRTGQRSPPHNVMGAWLNDGTDKMPARPHLGLSDAEMKSIADKLIRLRQG